jgi:subtilisin family serine protease
MSNVLRCFTRAFPLGWVHRKDLRMRQLVIFTSLIFCLLGCGSSPTLKSVCEAACLEVHIELESSLKTAPSTPASLSSPVSLLASLEANELLDHAGPAEVVSAFGSTSPAKMTFGDDGEALAKLLNLEQVWTYTQGEGVVVAVIDSGVDARHESLRGQVLPGYDFLTDSADTSDVSGHGTAVAALIAGNGKVKGFAPQARILPLRVLDKRNLGTNRDVARAILYAVNLLPELPNPYPAKVINLSLGRYADSDVIREAVRRAREAGAIIVAGAGNNGLEGLAYPAAIPEVIAVGSAHVAQEAWSRQRYSSYGPNLDMLVPTGGLTDTNEGRYAATSVVSAEAGSDDGLAIFSGTSVAAPQVSGVAALLLALEPDPRKVEALLLGSSSDLDKYAWDQETGYGLINPVASVRAALAQNLGVGVSLRLLDAGSKQEVHYQTGGHIQHLQVEAGSYTLFAWQDSNADGLWQEAEPCAVSEVLSLQEGLSQPVRLSLKTCTEME